MPLQKTPININFAGGLDTKTDPNQVAAGDMIVLENTIFDKGGLLTKRNGNLKLPALPNNTSTFVTTHNGNLVTLGPNLEVYSADTGKWSNKGLYQDARLSSESVIRTATSQNTVDVAIAANGAACAVYEDSNGSTYYNVFDSGTGESITASIPLKAGATRPRVAILTNYFIVTYAYVVVGFQNIEYIAIPIYSPSNVSAPDTFAVNLFDANAGYDILVSNNIFYISYYSSAGGHSIHTLLMNANFNQQSFSSINGAYGRIISLCADATSGTIWVTYWQDNNNNAYTAHFTSALFPFINTGTLVLSNKPVVEITSIATQVASISTCTNFYQINNTYARGVRSDYIIKNTIDAGNTVAPSTNPTPLVRSVGLGSKAFYANGKIFVGINYGGAFQPSYFIMDEFANIIGKYAYGNGARYASTYVLPQANVVGNTVQIGYLFKDQLSPVNKNTNINPNTVNGIYSQMGINLLTMALSSGNTLSAEIAGALHLTGGIPWLYDGVYPVEDNFFVWPEDSTVIVSAGGGVTAGTYFYQFTYEWTDSAGNIQRSAPSVPTGPYVIAGNSTVTLTIPTLRLTYKGGQNNVRIVIYRYSVAQPLYYQITSIASPILNNKTVDTVTYADSSADNLIIGNLLLYTSGGVIENIQAPGSDTITLYKSRMFIVDGENKNLLWFSKQVIQNTSVEMSDLLTIFVPPTTGAQGSTGPITALAALDDKLIIFKQNAIYYIVGTGPDNTGAQNDFSDVVFITSTVGCSNAKSIVFMPNGLMFQSDKGIWLLGRDLSTKYIGAQVDKYNSSVVTSSLNIPGTNQVRFKLDSGITLMYDYFFGKWGTFTNIPSISSTLYQGLDTFINKYGEVYQENVGNYYDGSIPVSMKFTTSWIKLSDLQGYQRLYFMYMLAKFISPHTLTIGLAYDYNPSIVQNVIIKPDNFAGYYGNDPLYGQQSPYGGGGDNGSVEQWRIFPERQKCESVQITLQEFFDPSLGALAGAGLTVSGLNFVIGVKKGYNVLSPNYSAG